jgi:hypothetical protein
MPQSAGCRRYQVGLRAAHSRWVDLWKGADDFWQVANVRKQFAGEMLGKRGEKPPLPCNCKRPFFDCTKPLPGNGWEGAVAQK